MKQKPGVTNTVKKPTGQVLRFYDLFFNDRIAISDDLKR